MTALALLSLVEIEAPSAKVRSAIKRAGSWLARTQQDDGSFGGGDPTTAGSNANSTGLSGWALGEVGSCTKARQAARWVKRLQAGAKDEALAPDKGAIAYNRRAFRTGKKDGIEVLARDQFRRATAQAAPALENLRKAQCKA